MAELSLIVDTQGSYKGGDSDINFDNKKDKIEDIKKIIIFGNIGYHSS